MEQARRTPLSDTLQYLMPMTDTPHSSESNRKLNIQMC